MILNIQLQNVHHTWDHQRYYKIFPADCVTPKTYIKTQSCLFCVLMKAKMAYLGRPYKCFSNVAIRHRITKDGFWLYQQIISHRGPISIDTYIMALCFLEGKTYGFVNFGWTYWFFKMAAMHKTTREDCKYHQLIPCLKIPISSHQYNDSMSSYRLNIGICLILGSHLGKSRWPPYCNNFKLYHDIPHIHKHRFAH